MDGWAEGRADSLCMGTEESDDEGLGKIVRNLDAVEWSAQHLTENLLS